MALAQSRRPYDSALRRERAAETRDAIVTAGADLLRGSSIRDWQGLTIRAVAERARVNERTVYRHFGNERGLRDAVMHRLEEDAGVDLGSLGLGDIAMAAARIFEHVSAYPLEARAPSDPTLSGAHQRQREALLRAVTAETNGWSEADRTTAAAVFDVLWSVASYERLVNGWQLDRDHAVRSITWAIGLIEEALRNGRRPD
jgi:AcrR family transcriptional regulator